MITAEESRNLPQLLTSFTLILLVTVLLLHVESKPDEIFRVYPVTDGIFEKIFLAFKGEEAYFVTATCRDNGIVSVSVTNRIQF